MNPSNLSQPARKSSLIPMLSVSVLFFMWGFITSLNDILIPYFKTVYSLSHFQANIVQFAFFTAYFVGAFVFFLFSQKGKDPITKIGYKNTLVIGLIISSVACFLFAFTAKSHLPFAAFLVSLFLLGIGLTFLQIAANPFVSIIGDSATASSRLNLTQAFNSLGTTLGPALGGYFIFNYFAKESSGADAVFVPYLFLACLLLALTFFIYSSEITYKEDTATARQQSGNIFRYPYVILGALGIFFYVGAEVSVGSNLVSYMKETIGLQEGVASAFLSYYWGGAMIGRFLGSVSLSDIKQSNKIIYMLLLAIAAFMVIFLVNYSLHGLVFHQIWFFTVFIALNFLFFYLGKGRPALSLAVFAMVNIGLILSSFIASSPAVSVWCLLSIGLFNSIMWGNVFTLAIDGLGKQTAGASSVLIMMIVGGAVLPPVQGALADVIGIKYSYFVPMISYFYLCFYGLKGYKIGKH
ncbi:MAG: sugar MFS transporter [Bacteroidales bacterium]|nr:sugar MFS transporter [Bacteroidales bacterium]MBP3254728.1 sugar MFS transporter [Bacteroidales bacterium]